MKIGELLKEERMKRGFTQAEMSAGVVSPSYYAKVEKGIHQITAENLIALLEANEIDFFTFFQDLQNKQKPTQHNFREWIAANINKDFYKRDKQHLEKIKKLVEENNKIKLKDKEMALALLDFTLTSLEEDDKKVAKQTKEILQNHIFNGSIWNHTTLSLYANIVNLYEFESNQLFIQSILKKGFSHYSTKQQLPILVILLNFSVECIETNRDSLAFDYLKIIENETATAENFFIKMMAKLSLLLLEVRKGKVASREEAESIFQVMKLSGMAAFAEQMKLFFEEHCAKVRNP